MRLNGGEAIEGEVVDAEPDESDTGGKTVLTTIAFDAGDQSIPQRHPSGWRPRADREGRALVPVQALSATGRSGEYSVEVARRDGTTKRVTVQVGLVADGRAAVTGDVHEGDEVVVPS